jgi:ribulose-5-phosphate 4-epimerase/fuculose-1-phosphate aldolase
MRPIPAALDDLAEQVCAAARRLSRDGLAVGTAGNISARDPESGLIAVTPAGYSYEEMTPADIAIVDPRGRLVRGELRPTSELGLHVIVLARHEAVRAIVHTHSPYALAFAVARHPIPLICNEGLFVGTPRVEVADFGQPATAALGEAAARLLERFPSAHAFLLANHGAVALGSTVDGAYTLAAQVEWEARVYHLARQIGEPHVLTQAQMDEIRRHYADLPPVERSPWLDEQ